MFGRSDRGPRQATSVRRQRFNFWTSLQSPRMFILDRSNRADRSRYVRLIIVSGSPIKSHLLVKGGLIRTCDGHFNSGPIEHVITTSAPEFIETLDGQESAGVQGRCILLTGDPPRGSRQDRRRQISVLKTVPAVTGISRRHSSHRQRLQPGPRVSTPGQRRSADRSFRLANAMLHDTQCSHFSTEVPLEFQKRSWINPTTH